MPLLESKAGGTVRRKGEKKGFVGLSPSQVDVERRELADGSGDVGCDGGVWWGNRGRCYPAQRLREGVRGTLRGFSGQRT